MVLAKLDKIEYSSFLSILTQGFVRTLITTNQNTPNSSHKPTEFIFHIKKLNLESTLTYPHTPLPTQPNEIETSQSGNERKKWKKRAKNANSQSIGMAQMLSIILVEISTESRVSQIEENEEISTNMALMAAQ